METDYEQQPETGMKASAKYLLYLLIICLAGCAAFDVNLHEMLEARGFLTKILFSIPRVAWIVSATALQAYFLVLSKKRLPASPSVSNIWTAIIALVVLGGCLSLFDSDSNILSAVEIIASFLTAILMVVTGLKIRVSPIKPIASLGNVLVWMPIVLLLVVVAFFSLMPDDFGQIQQKVSNDITGYRIITESYSESTIIYAVVFLILNVLCEAIIYGAMALVISIPEEETDADIEPMATEEISIEEEPAEADYPVSDELEKRPSRKILWICGIALAVAVGATALVLINKASSAKVDEATFLRSLNDEEGIFYLNIDDPDSNIILTRPDTLSSEVEVYLSDAVGCIEGNWPGIVQDGFVRSTDEQIKTTLKVVSSHHLLMEENGKKTYLYSQTYLENEANKVPIKKYGELEVQLFTADGHKFAKTNLYEMLPLDDNDTAHTIGYFPDSEEGQECAIKFDDESVTITSGVKKQVHRLSGQSDGVDIVIGHTYTNPDFGLEWTFINKNEGKIRFYDGSTENFKWGEGNPGTIVIYGDNGAIVSGAEIHNNGNTLTVMNFSDGSEFKMTQTK